jgi:hypothetical protein
MFGNIGGNNVAGYSFADPTNPRVIFEREAQLAETLTSMGDNGKYLCFSRTDLEKQVNEIIPQQFKTADEEKRPRPPMLVSMLAFANQILENFKAIEKGFPVNEDGLVLAEGLSQSDISEALRAVGKHTQQAAKEALEKLPDPYGIGQFVGFIFNKELLAVFSGGDVDHTYDRETFVALTDEYMGAKQIYALANPDHRNPYELVSRLMPEALTVLNYFDGNPEDAKRFSDAICILNGTWEIEDDFYNDGNGKPLLKLKVNCERDQFELYLDTEQIGQFFSRLNEIQGQFSPDLYSKIVSKSFQSAVSAITSRVNMIEKGYITVEKALTVQRSALPNLQF